MSCVKMCCVVSIVTVLCVNALLVADAADRTPRQAAAGKHGGAVLFFVEYQGQLREVLFDPIIFDQVLVNQGSAYSNVTGVFSAPVAGIYQFVFAAQLCRGDHNNRWIFMVNGDHRMVCHAQVSGLDTTLNTCYFMVDLRKGDRVWVKQQTGSCAWASTTSKTITFSGILLASEGVSMLGGKYGFGSPCPILSPSQKATKSACVSQGVTLLTVVVSLLLRCVLLH